MKKILIIYALFLTTIINAQGLMVYKSRSYGNRPRITWVRPGTDTLYREFEVWRADVKEKKSDTISTLHYVMAKDNQVKYIVVDTTLTEKSIYTYYIRIKTESGDTLTSPVAVAHNMGRIPTPRLVDFYSVRLDDKKGIELHWRLNHNFSVQTLSLFRSSRGDKDFVKIAELSGTDTTYTDLVPLSNHSYYYFILISDFFGYELPSAVLPASTLFKQKALPPYDITLNKNGDDIELHWRNSGTVLSGYKVFRSIGNGEFKPLHVMQSSNAEKVDFVDNIDSLIKTKAQGKMINYYVVNYSDSYVASEPSDTVSVYIPDERKPMPPEELDILSQDEYHVKLIWAGRKSEENISSYNVFQEEPEFKQLNTEPIDAGTNYFADIPVLPGKKYVFSVESVSYTGKKSQYKAQASYNTLSAYYHMLIDLNRDKDGIRIKWKKYPDKNIKEILLYRQEGENAPVLVKKFKNEDTDYVDKTVKPQTTYLYTVYTTLGNDELIPMNEGVAIRH